MTESEQQVKALALMQQLHELLVGNQNLQNDVADRLEILPMGRDMRNILMRRRNELSYYNEAAGLELKPLLDDIIERGVVTEFNLVNFPNYSIRTLYLRIYQSWLWLIDHLDRDGRYARLKRDYIIKQEKEYGRCLIRPKLNKGEKITDKLIASDFDLSLEGVNKLNNEITEFLKAPVLVDTLFDKKVSLSEEQVQLVKDSLAGLPETTFKISIEPTRVRILKKP